MMRFGNSTHDDGGSGPGRPVPAPGRKRYPSASQTPAMDVDLPSESLRNHWDDLVADLEATAEAYEAEGWSTLALHPGDVTTRTDDLAGLGVMVAGNEFEALAGLLDDGATFTETHVYRSAAGGVAFLVCALRDPARAVAVLVPAFYPQRGRSVEALAERARDAGAVDLHVHPLSRDRVVSVTIDDPDLVFPEGWA